MGYTLCSNCKQVTVSLQARPQRDGLFVTLGRWCYHCRTIEVTNSSVKVIIKKTVEADGQ